MHCLHLHSRRCEKTKHKMLKISTHVVRILALSSTSVQFRRNCKIRGKRVLRITSRVALTLTLAIFAPISVGHLTLKMHAETHVVHQEERPLLSSE
jgi:hypothetical protein